MTLYALRNVQGSATGLPQFCLQCKKMVVPMVSLEVVDDQDNAIGYLHARGTCKEEWLKANPQVKA
jgi:hypothetical protein